MYYRDMENNKIAPGCDPNWCYVCDRPAHDCACELDPNGPLPQSACVRRTEPISASGEDRYYCSFRNPQTGDADKLWFPTEAARSSFLADYKSDFPTLANTAHCWFVPHTIKSVCPNGKEHIPAIVSRCGGPSPKALNVCGNCGSAIAPLGNLQTNPLWMAISDQEEDRIRAEVRS